MSSLIVGNEYFWLTAEDYDALCTIYDGEDGLKNDFTLGPDGFYYASPDSISEDEYDFLMENEWANTTYYSTSTQPGGGM